ncbi:hypothetical protein BGZ63DRAFT_452041 [Mariannaea sp. PMI_226]|nr:hypothetical protein BGZ63DRAFT_452041 [Mariannaea sp. PMI_226]
MDLFVRHGDHGHEDEHGHGEGHGSEDSVRQHALASLYWYTIGAVLICGFLSRLASAQIARQRIKRRPSRSSPDSISLLERIFEAPKTAIAGSLFYRRRPAWLVALPLRKTFLVIVYAAFVSFLLTYKAVKHDGQYFERLGFRAGWITVTQTALPFLLAARTNPIGLILGTSYERVNWFHRWVSRIFVISATVHGSFFVTEWIIADFFWDELKTVGMVKWGLAAWAVLVWTLLSTLRPFRSMRYEFFVLQHIISVVLLLVFLLLHVPEHHHFSVWCAVVAFVWDIVTRSANPLFRNLHLRLSSGVNRFAHQAHISVVDTELTIATVRNVGFNWTPGQHVLIWSPTFPRQFPHPFTISSIPNRETSTKDVQLVMKTKDGFTKELNHWARGTDRDGGDGTLRVFLAGPYGSMPTWKQYETVVLVAASTGASFTTPILESLLTSKNTGRVRSISALYIARRKAHLEPYLQRISRLVPRAKMMGLSVRVEVAITKAGPYAAAGLDEDPVNESRERLITEPERETERLDEDKRSSIELERFSIDSSDSVGSERADQLLKEEVELGFGDGQEYDASAIIETQGRPDIEVFVASATGKVAGSVAVGVCGGSAIEKSVKLGVASLRSEQASQGLGANDVFLHVERSYI